MIFIFFLISLPITVGDIAPNPPSKNSDCDPDEPPEDVDMCPALPPSPPSNVRLKQDASGGAVTITWNQSKGDKKAEPIVYKVERISLNASEPQLICDDLVDEPPLECVDDGQLADGTDSPLAYGQSYIYRVYALNGDDSTIAVGVSNPATADITTLQFVPNVSPSDAGEAGPQPGDESQPEDDDSVVISEPDDSPDAQPEPIAPEASPATSPAPDVTISVSVPTSANEQSMACSVSDESAAGDDLLADLGSAAGGTQSLGCREQSGQTVEEFDVEVDYTLEFEGEELEDADLYAYDGNDWEEIDTKNVSEQNAARENGESSDERNLVKYASAKRIKGANKTKFSLKSKKSLKLAVVKSKRDGGIPLAVKVAIPLALVTATSALVVSRRQQLASVLSGPKPADLDLMPVKQGSVVAAPAQLEAPVAKPAVVSESEPPTAHEPAAITPDSDKGLGIHHNEVIIVPTQSPSGDDHEN